jgi:hypothetical protein
MLGRNARTRHATLAASYAPKVASSMSTSRSPASNERVSSRSRAISNLMRKHELRRRVMRSEMMAPVELSDYELDAVSAGTRDCGCSHGDKNQGNQAGLVNVNVQDNNVAILSGGSQNT